MPSPFDEIIDRVGTHCSKWDKMEPLYGVSPLDGIPMWVADMDFRPPEVIQKAVEDMAAHGVYGYYGDDAAYLDAVAWWARNRHGWEIESDWVFTANGLVNGTALCVDTWTKPGDGIVMFTPIYHAFGRILRAADRPIVECEMVMEDGRYTLDFDAYDAQMTGAEKMLILCSPHNPGGRVWTREELRGIADFAQRHDLIVVSDEIHCDLVYPGESHLPLVLAAPEITDRLAMLTAGTKTFGIAGAHVGNVIIPDDKLRREFSKRAMALGTSPNAFGLNMITAGYSAAGAEWVDALMVYLDNNRRIFDEGIGAIPGLASVPLQATYLSWVDFAGTGMDMAEVHNRVEKHARIAANHGATFGKGGESFMRFNIATPRARVEEAVGRLQDAFSDLQ